MLLNIHIIIINKHIQTCTYTNTWLFSQASYILYNLHRTFS